MGVGCGEPGQKVPDILVDWRWPQNDGLERRAQWSHYQSPWGFLASASEKQCGGGLPELGEGLASAVTVISVIYPL